MRLAIWLIHTKIKVVRIEQELRKVEELRNEFLHISHVVFGSREPSLSYTVKHSVSQIKMSSLKTQMKLTCNQQLQFFLKLDQLFTLGTLTIKF